MRYLERRAWFATSALFVLLVFGTYSTPLLSGRSFAGRDLLLYSLPIEKAVHDSYSQGRLPVWIPEISGGRPLAANPVVGAFYPIRALLALVSFPVAMRLYPILHWTIAGLGMLLLLRSLGRSPSAAWVGAVTYAFSGVAVADVFYPAYQPGMTLLPWIVWALPRGPGFRATALVRVSILFGLVMLAGDVFTIGMAILSGVLWIVLERSAGERLSALPLLGVAVVLGALLAAPQIVAAALWAPETRRAIFGIPLSHSLSLAISPFRLLELIVPFPFGPTWAPDQTPVWGTSVFEYRTVGYFSTLYVGAFALIAVFLTPRRVRGARFARGLLLLGVLVSVGPSFLPASWGHYRSPLPLRYPEKFAVAIVFALAVLAGLAFDAVRESRVPSRWVLIVAALITATAAAAATFPERAGALASDLVGVRRGLVAGRSPDPASLAAAQLAPALGESAFLWVLTFVALDRLRRPGPQGAWISAALLSLVPIAATRRIARTVPTEQIVSPSAFARFQNRADPAGIYRTLGEAFYLGVSEIGIRQWRTRPGEDIETWTVYQQVLMARGTIFNLDFDLGDFARMDSLRRISALAVREPGSPSFFANLALRWGIRFRDQEPIPGYRAFRQNAVHSWDVLPEALPDIRLVESWREARDALGAARSILDLERGEVVLETGRTGRGFARAGRIRMIERESAGFVLETDSPDPTWLFVLRGFWTHRTVRVDGEPIEAAPAQLAFSAVPVPAGRHRVDWREGVPGGSVSRWGPVLFVLLAAGLIARESRRGKTT